MRSCWKARQAASTLSGMASPSQLAKPLSISDIPHVEKASASSSWSSRRNQAPPTAIRVPVEVFALAGSGMSSESQTIQVACLACLAEGLSTKHAIPSLSNYFAAAWTDKEAVEESQISQNGALLPLVQDLLSSAHSRNALLRVEALAALRGLATNYSSALEPLLLGIATTAGVGSQDDSVESFWSQIMAVARLSLEGSVTPKSPAGAGPCPPASSPRRPSGTSTSGRDPSKAANASASTSPEDKAAQHAAQVLGSCLTAKARQLGVKVTGPGDNSADHLESAVNFDAGSCGGMKKPLSWNRDQALGEENAIIYNFVGILTCLSPQMTLLCNGPKRTSY